MPSTDSPDGRLVAVTPDLPVLSFPAYWVLCPARFLKRRPVRLFMEWAQAQADTHHQTIALTTLITPHNLNQPNNLNDLHNLNNLNNLE